MTKVVLLGDLHLGARGGSNHFSDYFNSFFTDTLYPYCQVNDIKNIIQLGDLFDSRTSLSYKAFHRCKNVWFDSLRKNGIHMTTLLGNHDIHYRESLEINAPELLLAEYSDCITIINKPSKIDLGGKSFDLIPWVCKENREDVLKFVKDTKSDYVCGHFELSGFKMQKTSIVKEEADDFAKLLSKKYDKVFSGHYHTISTSGNILYTGIPYQITWSDYDDQKGFFVLDTETGELTFVKNNNEMFVKIFLDENLKLETLIQYKDKVVRGYYDSSKSKKKEVDKFLTVLRTVGPMSLSTHDLYQDTSIEDVTVDTETVSDTRKLILDSLKDLFSTEDLPQATELISGMYDRALADSSILE